MCKNKNFRVDTRTRDNLTRFRNNVTNSRILSSNFDSSRATATGKGLVPSEVVD